MLRLMSFFYAVGIGRRPGIYLSWEETQRQVSGFAGARHKKFKQRQEAEDFIHSFQVSPSSSSSSSTNAISSSRTLAMPMLAPSRSEVFDSSSDASRPFNSPNNPIPSFVNPLMDTTPATSTSTAAATSSNNVPSSSSSYPSSSSPFLNPSNQKVSLAKVFGNNFARREMSTSATATATSATATEKSKSNNNSAVFSSLSALKSNISSSSSSSIPPGAKAVIRRLDKLQTKPLPFLKYHNRISEFTNDQLHVPMAKDSYVIYVDGGCDENRNVAVSKCVTGWGVLVLFVPEGGIEANATTTTTDSRQSKIVAELCGSVILDKNDPLFLGAEVGSNNTAELTAVGEALLWIIQHLTRSTITTTTTANQTTTSTKEVPVFIRFDSEYATKSVLGIFNGPKNNALISNIRDALQHILQQQQQRQQQQLLELVFTHVKGHNGNVWNEYTDGLAHKGKLSQQQQQQQQVARPSLSALLTTPETTSPTTSPKQSRVKKSLLSPPVTMAATNGTSTTTTSILVSPSSSTTSSPKRIPRKKRLTEAPDTTQQQQQIQWHVQRASSSLLSRETVFLDDSDPDNLLTITTTTTEVTTKPKVTRKRKPIVGDVIELE